LIKQYEKLPVENLAMGAKQFAEYLQDEEKAFEKNPWLKDIDQKVESILYSKLEKASAEMEKQLENLLKNEKNLEKKNQIFGILNKLKTSNGKKELIAKLKPSVIAVVLSLVK
jgi:uncharacterized Fe-S cluster-containing protein